MSSIKISIVLVIATALQFCSSPKSENNTQPTDAQANTLVKPTSYKLEQAWQSDTVLQTPEAVLFDESNGVYYVSCIGNLPPDKKDNDGYIAKLDQKGRIVKLKWITGLHAPKGLGIVGNQLYVTDIDRVVVIDIKESRKIKSIPLHDSKFLNDIAVSRDGKIYVSDTYGNSLYHFDGDIPLLLYQDTAMGGPNGLWAEAGGIVCATFTSGEVFKYSFSDKGKTVLNKNIPGGDGIESYQNGYLVSNWNGEVYFLDAQNQQHLILDTKGTMNAADIEVVNHQNLLVVPTFLANKVVAYTIKTE